MNHRINSDVLRVLRGGGYSLNFTWLLSVIFRDGGRSVNRDGDVGFRVVVRRQS
jgi:hypothetical protein